MPIATKRLGAPPAPSDGTRILVTRYRPRAVRRGAETWAEWDQRLAPSVALLDLCFGKERASGRVVLGARPPIAWPEFVRRFRAEMCAPAAQEALAELRVRARTETVTLLCYCADETRCHRSLLAALLAAPER